MKTVNLNQFFSESELREVKALKSSMDFIPFRKAMRVKIMVKLGDWGDQKFKDLTTEDKNYIDDFFVSINSQIES